MTTFSSSAVAAGDFEIIIIPPRPMDSSAETMTNRVFRSVVINGHIPEAPWKDLIVLPNPIPVVRPKTPRLRKTAVK